MIILNTYAAYREKYRAELDENVIPFWLKYGQDTEHGGLYTCLDRTGTLYCTDKSVWMQGRCAWVFSYLCGLYGYREDYHAFAKSCLEFLDAHCIDPQDVRMYFSVTGDGQPLRKRRYFFSETFYIIACAEYASVFGDETYMEKARRYYDFVMRIYRDPSTDPYKITPKYTPGVRPSKAYAEPMILLNVSHIMSRCDSANAAKYDAAAKELTDTILRLFYKPELKALLETTGPDGEFLRDAFGGRTMNPGHSIEGVWFLVTQANQTGDKAILEKAEEIYAWAMERGWDRVYGGLLSFVDVLGFPPEALEHDMKLWWPTCETIISSLMLFEATGRQEYWDNFVKADAFAFSCFSDRDGGGEWYGYLHRDATPTLPACKGNLFKGPFHVPRMLAIAERCLARLEAKAN